MKQQRQTYIQYSRENIKKMMQKLQEYHSSHSADLVEEFRRYFHSIKGTAQTFLLSELGSVGLSYEGAIIELGSQNAESELYERVFSEGIDKVKQELDKLDSLDLMERDEVVCHGKAAFTTSLLFMDDDWPLLELARRIFEKEGYTVYITSSYKEALEILVKHIIGLFIVDYNMTGLNGDEVLRRIRKEGVNTPIAFLTGDSSLEIKEKLIQSGALEVINKPFKPQEIVEHVKKILAAAI